MTTPEPLRRRLPATSATTAERLIDALESHGITHVFGNAGTDFPPIIEALSRRTGGDSRIEPVLVPHENVAMAMAYGAALASGKPQVVMVHVGLGTANALCGLFNAARQNIPLILIAGRTPVLEEGRLGARTTNINWAQELFDQSGMVRELVKWEYELRDPAQVETVVQRAFSIAQSSPEGPAYVVLPREVLAATEARPNASAITRSGGPRAPVTAGLPDPAAVTEIAGLLTRARRPVIITADMGRTAAGFAALTAFAEQLHIPVVQYRPRFASIPCSSRVHGGYDPAPWVRDADLLLVVECDVPWIPDAVQLSPEAIVVQIGQDPLHSRYPIRNFPANLSIRADAPQTLDLLLKTVGRPAPGELASREEWISRHIRKPLQLHPSNGADSLTHRFVSRCIADAMDESTVLFDEYPFHLEELRVETHGRYFSHSPAGGLGWAVGACLGMRLMQPQSTCIAAVGDGTYMFSNPTPAHFVSRARGLPFITVIFNNRRWAAVHRATLSMYPGGTASSQAQPLFATLEPSPDYEKVVEASGGLGIRVEKASELPEALRRAIKAVREDNQQVVLNVLTEIEYGRSS